MADTVSRTFPILFPVSSRLALAAWLGIGVTFLTSCTGDYTTGDVRSGIKKAFGGTDEQIFVGEALENYYHPNVIMKRGESYFEKEEYAEALVEYKHFLELHKNHVLAPYAAFRIGEIHVKMARTVDRDPEPMNKAIAAFEQMRKDFPGSRYDSQAQQKLVECHEWLAQMHLFVGQFYYRRGSYLAAAHRFEQVTKTYPDKPIAADALYFLAKTYYDLGAEDWARDNLVVFMEKYPNHTYSDDGKNLLTKLGGAQPTTLLAQKSDAGPVSDASPMGQRTRADAFSQPSAFATSTSSASSSTGLLGTFPSLELSGANTLSQSGIPCRLGAWC